MCWVERERGKGRWARVECALGGTGASEAPTARPIAVSVDVVARTAERCGDAEMNEVMCRCEEMGCGEAKC